MSLPQRMTLAFAEAVLSFPPLFEAARMAARRLILEVRAPAHTPVFNAVPRQRLAH